MNGFSTEEDSRDGPPPVTAPFFGQSCCLIADGERCIRPAGNASFSKRIQKSISAKKLKLDIDKSTVSRHFRNIPVNEKETLAYFIYMVKSNKSRMDQKLDGSKLLE